MDDKVEIELCGSSEHNITVVYYHKTVLIKLPITITILYGKQFVHFSGKLFANIANASAVNISRDLFINFAVTVHHHHYILECAKSGNNNIIVRINYNIIPLSAT